MNAKFAALVFLSALMAAPLSGCADHTRLELSAKALSKAADECLLEVRDRKMKYDKSPSCTSLGTLSMQYIEAGGFKTNTPAKYELIAVQARETAWMALALSESGKPSLRIW